jgi:hypothetical protein
MGTPGMESCERKKARVFIGYISLPGKIQNIHHDGYEVTQGKRLRSSVVFPG